MDDSVCNHSQQIVVLPMISSRAGSDPRYFPALLNSCVFDPIRMRKDVSLKDDAVCMTLRMTSRYLWVDHLH